MRDSKLINLLRTLDKAELRQFYRYIHSPFFTKSIDALRLYDYIRRHHPNFDTRKLERPIVYANLFPKTSFNGPKLRNLILILTKILEDYLIYLKYQQNAFEKKKILTKIYGERNLNVFFEKKTVDLLKDLEEQPYRDTAFFHHTYLLQRDFYFHPNTLKRGEAVTTFKKSIHNLQVFYHLERLRIVLELKSREQIYPEIHGFEISDLEIADFENITSRLLKELIALATTKKESSFFRAKKLLLQELHQISPQDGVTILPALLNYAIQQLSKQEKKYIKEVFDLYKTGIESNLLISENKISDATFFNIIAVGSKLKEFEYIHKFILEKERFLSKESRVEVKTLALSFLYYNQTDYDKVISTLNIFKFSNISYKTNAKTLLIRTYYQLYEQDATYYKLVLSSCDSCYRFIKNNENFSIKKRESYINFLFLLKKITKQKELQNSTSAIKVELIDLLDGFSDIFAIEWLREKINEL